VKPGRMNKRSAIVTVTIFCFLLDDVMNQ